MRSTMDSTMSNTHKIDNSLIYFCNNRAQNNFSQEKIIQRKFTEGCKKQYPEIKLWQTIKNKKQTKKR